MKKKKERKKERKKEKKCVREKEGRGVVTDLSTGSQTGKFKPIYLLKTSFCRR